MGIGTVSVLTVNNQGGGFAATERCFLFFGVAASSSHNKELLTIGPQTDLDTLLGSGSSDLKTQLKAAIANAADPNFVCYAMPITVGTDDWKVELDRVFTESPQLAIEGVVICPVVSAQADVTAAQTAMNTMLSKYAVYLSCHMAVAGIDPLTQTWSAYKTAIKALNNAVVAARVSLVPQLHGNNLGVVIGRLCNPAASLADSPMRTATGALIGLGPKPKDSANAYINMADMKELSDARFSVPQWYAGYNGTFWADHMMLDNESGDFQVFENLRVMDYLARRVRVLVIARIANRLLNSTSKSIELHKTYFGRPLREAARPIVIGAGEIPGLIQPPEGGDIAITWTSQTEVAVGITAAPYQNPKKITVWLGLDLSRGVA
ncbi:MAG: hypothetical protein RL095_2175 [Verrucomicrobiota bacterium]|jgi:hypothetical protein